MSLPFAAFDAESIAVLIPIVALMIPIVVVLTKHQQRMTELLRQNNVQQPNMEMESLRQEMRMLRETVHQQTIQMDTMLSARSTLKQDDIRVNLGP